MEILALVARGFWVKAVALEASNRTHKLTRG